MAKHDQFSRNPRRLQGYNYCWDGLYFITICTKGRLAYFGQVVEGEMRLSAAGTIARDRWLQIPLHHPQVSLGEFVVMPNHVHGIIGIETPVKLRTPVTPASNVESAAENSSHSVKNQLMKYLSPMSGSTSRIIGSYKSACSRQINQECNGQFRHFSEPFAWQPRFHDRIIRNQQELKHIEDYIVSNPANWAADCFYR